METAAFESEKNEAAERREKFLEYRTDQHNIVSTVAYLIGVPRAVFDNGACRLSTDIYDTLDRRPDYRILRNLCRLRTVIEQHFGEIARAITYDLQNLHTLPQTKELVRALSGDGVSIVKANPKPDEYIVRINQLVKAKADSCRDLFPIWVEWEYIRDLFLMPNGEKAESNKATFRYYMDNINLFPYQQYLNWDFRPDDNSGNILYNDEKFLKLLYIQHREEFAAFENVRGEGSLTKQDICAFLDKSLQTVMLVDCENCDPLRLCAALQSMSAETLRKIVKIILYNDVNASSAWLLLSRYCAAPIEHQMTERVKNNKSLVDIELVAGACREHYQNHVDSFLLCSSDSDFWGLIRSLSDASFFVMVEKEKVSGEILERMQSSDIRYCFLNNFCQSGSSYQLRVDALLQECQDYLARRFTPFSAQEMLNAALGQTRIVLSPKERQQFYDRFLRTMHLSVGADGNVTVQFGG